MTIGKVFLYIQEWEQIIPVTPKEVNKVYTILRTLHYNSKRSYI